MIQRDQCLICEGREFLSLYSCTDYLVTHRDFNILKCNSCGFLFTQGVPGIKEMGIYYDSPDYISHTGGNRSVTDRLYEAARRIMLYFKKRTVKILTGKREGAVLDIGAGTGHFLKCMKDDGWLVSGIEVNEAARKYSREVNGTDLERSLDEAPFTGSSFDVVTMWHVLEHIHEPEEYLKTVSELLKPGGMLLVAVPNNASADATHYREKWAAFDVPRHLWHFDNICLQILVERHGFFLIKRMRMPFDSFYISILSEKNRNCRFPLVTGIIKGFVFWLKSLIIKEKSSSLIHAFKKL